MVATFKAEMDGVRVAKSVEFTGGEDANIAFHITSTRNEPVEIRLRDSVPDDDIQVQSIELDHWTSDEGAVTYERTLQPGETVRTEYRLTAPDAADASELTEQLTAPSLVVMDPPAETEEPFTRGAGEAVFTFDGPDSAEATASAVEAASGGKSSAKQDDQAVTTEYDEFLSSIGEFNMPDDDVETAELVTGDVDAHEREDLASDAKVDDTEDAQSTDDASDADVETGSTDDSDTGSAHAESSDAQTEAEADVVEASVRSVEEVPVGEHLERVRHGPTDADEGRASLDARVRYLQTQFQDLAAYIDAMEAFIDEHGTGKQVLTALTTDMETVKDRLDRIDGNQRELRTRLDTVETQLETLRTEVETREDSVDDELDELADSLDALDAAQQDMETDVEDLKSFQQKLQDAI